MKSYKYLLFTFIFGILLIPMVSAIQYNGSYITGKYYDVSTHHDEYTGLYNQDITFLVHKVVNQNSEGTSSVSIEGYEDGEPPSEWHASRSILQARVNYECVAKSASTSQKIPFAPFVLTNTFSEVVDGSSQSLKFSHFAYSSFSGEFYPSEAWYNMPEMTIGEVTFDVMVHLNVSNAKFYFALDHTNNNSKMVSGYFDLDKSGSDVYTRAHVFPVGDRTGNLSTTPTTAYTTGANQFNWMKVKIFFDTWNDLYNITFQQYALDWSFIDSPTSLVVRGDQNDGNNRTNTGARLSGGHILDKLQFKLVSSNPNPPQESYAWVDNVNFRYYEFPAVYADTIYSNRTFRLQSYEPKKWYNKTIVSSYEPPAYPQPGQNLAYGSDYWSQKTRAGLLTGWELAPTWMYTIPMFVPTDNQQIIKDTLIDYINDSDNPLEERGTLKPSSISDYNTDPDLGPFHEMDFELLESQSSDYVYYFNSTATDKDDYKIKIEYSADYGAEGWFKHFKMYTGEETTLGVVDYLIYGTEAVPGYSTFLLIGVTVTVALYMMYKMQRKSKIVSKY